MQATLHHRAHLAKSGAKIQLFLETTKYLYNKNFNELQTTSYATKKSLCGRHR